LERRVGSRRREDKEDDAGKKSKNERLERWQKTRVWESVRGRKRIREKASER